MSMQPSRPRFLTSWLESAPSVAFATYSIAAAFMTYFCMYAFRKPFAAAHFTGLKFLGTEVDLKTAFVVSQIIGYTLAKYGGIKICSEIIRGRRALALVVVIVLAEMGLLLFAVLPIQWKVVGIFINGAPLAMVWGLTVSYLEGRRTSELLLAGLSCSYILGSGITKDVGRAVLGLGISEWWMPFVTGLCFLPPFVLAVWLLDRLPRPDRGDIEARVEREPMFSAERIAFIKQFFFGLALLFVVYMFITAYRDYRDNYAVEMFAELGYGTQPAIFLKTELPVAFGVMACLAALNLIRDNRLGLVGAYVIMMAGTTLMGVGTLLLDSGAISGLTWMILTGLGAFLTYVPFGSVLFDRMIASTRTVGTAVFAIYVADALGYTGSVAVLLYKDLAQAAASRLGFFRGLTYFMSLLGTVCLLMSCLYFARKGRSHEVDGPRSG